MECFIYKSSRKNELYLFLVKENDFESVPDALRRSFGAPVFVMRLKLDEGRKLARSDVQEVMQSLQEKGYFLQMPPQDPSLLQSEHGRNK